MMGLFRRFCLPSMILLGATGLLTETVPGSPAPHLADYDAELRRSDGRVDVEAMARRLTESQVTSYYWLVWHAATDWEDLKLFLPLANKAGIEVWVYLVPPSEGPPHGYPASEPFKLDYVRWAEEIARLSLAQTNLAGWVIDDFYANRQLLTPGFTSEIRARARSINPSLSFRPLMYFSEITREFVDSYRNAIDGVVVAYPRDREEISHTRAILDGALVARPGEFRFHLPFIVMTAASANEFKLRHGEPASAERIAEWLRMSLRAWQDGQCDGVVTYCLDKSPQSQVFPLAQKLFGDFRESRR